VIPCLLMRAISELRTYSCQKHIQIVYNNPNFSSNVSVDISSPRRIQQSHIILLSHNFQLRPHLLRLHLVSCLPLAHSRNASFNTQCSKSVLWICRYIECIRRKEGEGDLLSKLSRTRVVRKMALYRYTTQL
jgi:hypothetical protein